MYVLVRTRTYVFSDVSTYRSSWNWDFEIHTNEWLILNTKNIEFGFCWKFHSKLFIISNFVSSKTSSWNYQNYLTSNSMIPQATWMSKSKCCALFLISSMFISDINKQKVFILANSFDYNQKANQFIIRLKDHFKNRQLNCRITKHFNCLRASMSVCFNCVRNTLINIRFCFDWKWWRIWDNDRVTLGIETTRVNHSMDHNWTLI